jgi:hypothetical protein
MAPLFPYRLLLTLPNNDVLDLSSGIGPDSVQVAEDRAVQIATLLSGKGSVRYATDPTSYRIKVASAPGFAITGEQADLLKSLAVGTECSLDENLSNRSSETVWSHTKISATPTVALIGYSPQTGHEYFTFQFELLQTEA